MRRAGTSGRRLVVYCTMATCLCVVLAGLLVLAPGFGKTLSGSGGLRNAGSAPEEVASHDKADASPRDTDNHGARRQAFSRFTGSPPQALTIPRIGVRATRIERLGLAPNGEIEVPQDADNPGWFAPGAAPGEFGPAVIAGHLDDRSGPAVFYRLSQLEPGDRVRVIPRRGPVRVFEVERVVSVDKDDFPTDAVYGPTTRPELRLITCGGRYDDTEGYVRNTLVFAHLV